MIQPPSRLLADSILFIVYVPFIRARSPVTRTLQKTVWGDFLLGPFSVLSISLNRNFKLEVFDPDSSHEYT